MSIKKELPDKLWTRVAYILMVKFHWTLNEIKQLPLSTINELNELMEWERKEIEKESRQ